MELASAKKMLLGTEVAVQVPGRQSHFLSFCFGEIKRIEDEYSRFLQNSKLTYANSRLGKWQTVSPEFIFLLKKSLEFGEKTRGSFDITIKSALEDLGYANRELPKNQDEKNFLLGIRRALEGKILIDEKNSRILLNSQIDFGGLGKGYAIDRAASILERHGVLHYCINAGGDIYAKSAHGEKPWEILLEHPDDSSRAIGKIDLNSKSLAASAPNKRKWGKNHHLIDPKTGKSASGAKCIFVLANTAIEADAYATALFVSGFEWGIEISKTLPIEILFVSNEGKMYQSPGFKVEFYK
ncbi:MAG: FAD:protein FMN transferase [Candidatus Micrarchaeota archaeon]